MHILPDLLDRAGRDIHRDAMIAIVIDSVISTIRLDVIGSRLRESVEAVVKMDTSSSRIVRHKCLGHDRGMSARHDPAFREVSRDAFEDRSLRELPREIAIRLIAEHRDIVAPGDFIRSHASSLSAKTESHALRPAQYRSSNSCRIGAYHWARCSTIAWIAGSPRRRSVCSWNETTNCLVIGPGQFFRMSYSEPSALSLTKSH